MVEPDQSGSPVYKKTVMGEKQNEKNAISFKAPKPDNTTS